MKSSGERLILLSLKSGLFSETFLKGYENRWPLKERFCLSCFCTQLQISFQNTLEKRDVSFLSYSPKQNSGCDQNCLEDISVAVPLQDLIEMAVFVQIKN